MVNVMSDNKIQVVQSVKPGAAVLQLFSPCSLQEEKKGGGGVCSDVCVLAGTHTQTQTSVASHALS